MTSQERIKADAEAYVAKTRGQQGRVETYIAGATAEHDRAKVIEKTLKLVEYHLLLAINRTNAGHEINYDKLVSYLSEKTTKALEQWKSGKGKEVEDE